MTDDTDAAGSTDATRSTGTPRTNRRRVLQATGAGLAGLSLGGGRVAADPETIEVSVYVTEQLWDSEESQGDGYAPRDVAADYVEHAIEQSPAGDHFAVDVTAADARMDLRDAAGADDNEDMPDGQINQQIKEFLCCGDHATHGDPTSEVSKDANILLTYHRELDGNEWKREDGEWKREWEGGGTFGNVAHTWVGENLRPVYGQAPQTMERVDDGNMTDEWHIRIWKVIHEVCHALPKDMGSDCENYRDGEADMHWTGNRYTDSRDNLIESPMAFRAMNDQDPGENCCGDYQPPSWGDGDYNKRYVLFQYTSCTAEQPDGTPRLVPQSYADGCANDTLCGKVNCDACSDNRVCSESCS